jgi:hypothetical protein
MMMREGYHQLAYDYSLFTLKQGDDITAPFVYVDDIILAVTSLTQFTRIEYFGKEGCYLNTKESCPGWTTSFLVSMHANQDSKKLIKNIKE